MRTPRITARGWSVLVVSTAIGVIGRLLGSLELLCAGLVGACSFAGALLVCAFSRRPRVQFSRRVPAEVFADDELRIELTAISGDRRTPNLLVEEHTGGGTSRTVGLAAMKPRQSRVLHYRLEAGSRGVRMVGPCVVSQSDALGFTRRVGAIGDATPLIVWPRPRMLDVSAAVQRVEAVPAMLPTLGVDRDEFDIRPFVEGDELRRVHWRTTARTGQLMVRADAISAEPARPLLVLDAREESHTAGSLELALSLVCGYVLSAAMVAEPRVVIVTQAGTFRSDDRIAILDALAYVPSISAQPASADLAPFGYVDVPDVLITGPYAEITGPHAEPEAALLRSGALVRCASDGSTFEVTRAAGARR